jgi:hypothetical protein
MNNVKKTFIQPDGLVFLLLSLSTISFPLLAPTDAAAGAYTKIDPPGSIDTHALSISGGNIAGWYQDAGGDHGFLRAADGTITSFDGPGSSATLASSVNASGVITGDYQDANYYSHGYVRSADGTITSFDAPGAIQTFPGSINAEGVITGTYQGSSGFHGFVRAADGTITSFDVPGAIYLSLQHQRQRGNYGELPGQQRRVPRLRAGGRRDDHEFRCAGIDNHRAL